MGAGDDANMSDHGVSMLPDNASVNGGGSHISFAKEKELSRVNVTDAMSAHSGSIVNGMDVGNMDIDEVSVHSHHVAFNLDDTASLNGSVATTALNEKHEQVTPPGSPNATRATKAM